MTNKVNIREMSHDGPATTRIEELFRDMYSYMNEHGLMLKLAEKGERKWFEGVQKGLGRFGILLYAESEGKVFGFAHGSLRLAPDYLGSKKLGVITHVFVDKEYRRSGLGEMLVLGLEKWFAEKEVHSVELQVLALNKSGIAFWEKLGYAAELSQHRKAGSELT